MAFEQFFNESFSGSLKFKQRFQLIKSCTRLSSQAETGNRMGGDETEHHLLHSTLQGTEDQGRASAKIHRRADRRVRTEKVRPAVLLLSGYERGNKNQVKLLKFIKSSFRSANQNLLLIQQNDRRHAR